MSDPIAGLVLADKAITAALAILDLVEQHNVNAELLLAMRAKAKAEGTDITASDRQILLNNFQAAIDSIPVKTS